MLIGHAGHEEVEGTMGEAPDHIVLVEDEEDVDELDVKDPSEGRLHLADDPVGRRDAAIIKRLRERFPAIIGPRTDDICYATTNRQAAVKQLARESDLVLVIGSRNSSNSNRLVEVAREHGAESHLIDNESQVRRGVAGGASGWSGSRPARARPRSSSSVWSSSSAAAGTDDCARARGGLRGRPLHAPEGDPPGDGGRRLRARTRGRAVRTLVVSDLHLGVAHQARRAVGSAAARAAAEGRSGLRSADPARRLWSSSAMAPSATRWPRLQVPLTELGDGTGARDRGRDRPRQPRPPLALGMVRAPRPVRAAAAARARDAG